MKRFLLFFTLLFILACTCSMPNSNTTATPTPTVAVTEPISIPPTQAATADAATELPANTPTTEACTQQFFTEEFEVPLCSAWSTRVLVDTSTKDQRKVTVEPKDGNLVWDLGNEFVSYYLFYTGSSYTDVKVEATADNRGKNNNSVSMVCRYDPEVGWYETNVSNGGLYNIAYAEITSDGKVRYKALTNGGSNKIHQGKDVNEYSFTCSGNTLTLAINGEEVKSFEDRKYGLQQGGVGVAVASGNALPILIEMDWFRVSEP